MLRWLFLGVPLNLAGSVLISTSTLVVSSLIVRLIAAGLGFGSFDSEDTAMVMGGLPRFIPNALAVFSLLVGIPAGWSIANNFKIGLARRTKRLRRYVHAQEFGKGGSTAFSGMLEDWGHRYEPGAILLGRSRFEPFWKVGWEDDRGFLTIAASRAGKGRSAIIPNLLTWPGSALVIDPKGTNAAVTAAARGRGGGRVTRFMGQEVHVVDPFGIVPGMRSARFNPLAAIDPASNHFAEEVGLLADALVVQDRDGDASHWDEGVRILLAGIIAFLVQNRPGSTLLDVRLALTVDEDRRDRLYEEMQKAGGIPGTAASLVLNAGPNERGSFLTTALRNTQWLESTAIHDIVTESDFDIRDLKRKWMTVYIVLPPEYLEEHKRFMRLFVNLAIRGMSAGQKPPFPVLFLLDEFYSLGRLSILEKASGLLAGYAETADAEGITPEGRARKEREQQRAFNQRMEYFREQTVRFQEQLDRLQQATAEALRENEKQLAAAREELERIRERAYEITMPDGSVAKVYRDGDKVRDDAGAVVRDLSAADVPDTAPTWAQRQASGDAFDKLTAEHAAIVEYQGRLDRANERLSSADLTVDDIDGLQADAANMPDAVRVRFEVALPTQPAPADVGLGGQRQATFLSKIDPGRAFAAAASGVAGDVSDPYDADFTRLLPSVSMPAPR